MNDLHLTTVIHGTLTPDQVRHQLSEDGWSTFDLGPLRVQVPRTDVSRVRAARALARTIAAQADFWDRDLGAIEAELEAVDAKQTAEPETPQADDPGTAGEPAADTSGIGELPENQERAFQKFEAGHATQPPEPDIEEDLPNGDTGKRPARRRTRSS
ncbi:hypothetical protein ACWEQG_01520 [Microbispora sp. NPDC004025]